MVCPAFQEKFPHLIECRDHAVTVWADHSAKFQLISVHPEIPQIPFPRVRGVKKIWNSTWLLMHSPSLQGRGS